MDPSGTAPLAPGPPPPAIDGALRSAISQAIVRIHAEHYGKGATQAKTYAWDNVIVTVLRRRAHDGGAHADRTSTRADTVREVRTAFQHTMADTFRAADRGADRARACESFMSQIDPARGTGVEVFILVPDARRPRSERAAGPRLGSPWPARLTRRAPSARPASAARGSRSSERPTVSAAARRPPCR